MLDNKELHHFLTNRLINCITSKLIMITKQAGMRHSITYSHNMINQLLIGTSSYHKLARTWSQDAFKRKIIIKELGMVGSTGVHYLQKECKITDFLEPSYLGFKAKLADNDDDSARAVSLADGPPIALLLTALVQLAA